MRYDCEECAFVSYSCGAMNPNAYNLTLRLFARNHTHNSCSYLQSHIYACAVQIVGDFFFSLAKRAKVRKRFACIQFRLGIWIWCFNSEHAMD